jgi:hypothetical protein
MRSKPNPSYEDFVMRTHHTLRTTRKRHNPYPITIYEADRSDDALETLWLIGIGAILAMVLVLVVAHFVLAG